MTPNLKCLKWKPFWIDNESDLFMAKRSLFIMRHDGTLCKRHSPPVNTYSKNILWIWLIWYDSYRDPGPVRGTAGPARFQLPPKQPTGPKRRVQAIISGPSGWTVQLYNSTVKLITGLVNVSNERTWKVGRGGDVVGVSFEDSDWRLGLSPVSGSDSEHVDPGNIIYEMFKVLLMGKVM